MHLNHTLDNNVQKKEHALLTNESFDVIAKIKIRQVFIKQACII